MRENHESADHHQFGQAGDEMAFIQLAALEKALRRQRNPDLATLHMDPRMQDPRPVE